MCSWSRILKTSKDVECSTKTKILPTELLLGITLFWVNGGTPICSPETYPDPI